jgi:hypothetical protein
MLPANQPTTVFKLNPAQCQPTTYSVTSKKQDATKSTIGCHQTHKTNSQLLTCRFIQKKDGSNLGSISIFNLNAERRGKIGCHQCRLTNVAHPLSKPKIRDATVFKLPVLLLTIEDQKKRGRPQFFRMPPITPYLF